MIRLGVLLIIAALIAGMAGCDGYVLPPSENLEIRTWYDLDDVRDNLRGHHILMNDLDSTTLGYQDLASPTANGGRGWRPIGIPFNGLRGTFDGRGYEISDLFVSRPDEHYVGLFGGVDREGIVKNVGVVNATVIGKGAVGGLAGDISGIVSDCYFSGNVTAEAGAGGLLGGSAAGAVSNSHSVGTVTCDGNNAGGLMGTNYDGSVSNSYSTCNVGGANLTGGLVGENIFGTISNCYSTGDVTGNGDVGGLVGRNHYRGTVSNSYSTGNVTGHEYVGGLVGRNSWNSREGTVNNSFWDIETSGQTTSAGGTGKTTAQMKDIITFSGVGWNIVAVALNETNSAYIWNIVDGVTYPFLSWQAI